MNIITATTLAALSAQKPLIIIGENREGPRQSACLKITDDPVTRIKMEVSFYPPISENDEFTSPSVATMARILDLLKEDAARSQEAPPEGDNSVSPE